eukprot:gnl/TRDRNA2_/TRDRNA2_45876_c0_seq1.p1 gnl/TRDRNA2_/TRDRNA2_45876_c0~~gnl/TRDRNA2_/TRDRNA2_45876_c0_seq1.p1  ORF type:complete len:417 (-),score=73.90 gnl/TRDRNA2_/TRDRNA2_45876_c0_seq1:46-1125(-)
MRYLQLSCGTSASPTPVRRGRVQAQTSASQSGRTTVCEQEDFSSSTAGLSSAAAEVVMADSVGRSLEALRLLNCLGNDAEVPEAKRIRATANLLKETLQTIEDASAAAQVPGSGWHARELEGSKNSRPSELLYKYDFWTGDVELVGTVNRPYEPLRLWAFFREFTLGHLWMPTAREIVEVGRFAQENIFYRVRNAPVLAVISPTESFQDRSYIDALDEHGVLGVVGFSPPAEATVHKGIRVPPPPAGVKRLTTNVRNLVRPISKTEVSFTVHITMKTPFRFLPSAIVGQIAGIIFQRLATKLNNVHETWSGSPHEQAVLSAKRATYYQELEKRIERAIRRRGNVQTKIRQFEAHGSARS